YFLEIYRIVSQRQIQDHIGPISPNPPIHLPPTDPDFKSRQNTTCCS
ncbi:unnamed protein product, partial [Rotaria magnacalcarata]